MASQKKESEGIALLSIYGDEDDEMDDYREGESDNDAEQIQNDAKENELGEDDNSRIAGSDSIKSETPSPLVQQQQVGMDNLTPNKISNFGGSATTTPQLAFSSPPQSQLQGQQQAVVFEAVVSRSRLTIVDYAHDEVTMSPEAEEGEIMTRGQAQYAEELQTINESQVQSPPGTLQTLPPQSLEINVDDAIALSSGDVDMVPADEKDDDLLEKFLPPPPKAKCSDELQAKIIKFLAIKSTGRIFNAEVRNRKDYRNPDFLSHAVQYQGIDEIGSCFSKDVFDPHGYDKSDFYDEIEADIRREMEKREQERRASPKVDFISGGTQPGAVTFPKPNLPIPGLLPGSAAPNSADAIPRDSRQNKKSKWDKVDVDRPAISAHAALLSAANAGSGYAAFAQQKRKEAEEKRSSDKKLDRRS